ncbi:hypothetical protein [Caballeronia sp. LZ001]|uniref:hypothetical protein n=1 Tax=Caballeronia sp. LZ001 TaxID=3038553 RepID=UPI0038D38F84
MRNLSNDIVGLRQSMRDLEADLHVFEDLKQFKSWLKHLKRRQAALHFDEMPF